MAYEAMQVIAEAEQQAVATAAPVQSVPPPADSAMDVDAPPTMSHRGLTKKPSRMNFAMRSMFGKRKD